MSFSNELLTILKIDSKDWKKGLTSISQAEKQYYKESSNNTQELIQSKKKLKDIESERGEQLKVINEKIAKAESSRTKAMKAENKELETVFKNKLKLYKQERTELKANYQNSIDSSKEEISKINQKIDAQIKYNKILQETKAKWTEYGSTVKKANEEARNAISMYNKSIDEKIAKQEKDRKQVVQNKIAEINAKHEIISALKEQRLESDKLALKEIDQRYEVINALKLQKTQAAKTAIAEINAKYEVINSLKKQKLAEEKLRSDTIYALKTQKREQQKYNETLRDEYNALYKNTTQQNQYNKAKTKLNTMLQNGAITQKQYNTALEKEKQNLAKSNTETKSLTNSVVRHLRQIETLVVAYYTLSRGITFTIGKGIEVNRMIEDNTNGIAALLSANTQVVLSNGQVANSYEKFKIGQKIAVDTMQAIKKASVDTYATFPQLTEIFQQAQGQTLSMGDSFGTTVDEITKNTIKLAQRMSNIGGAIGQPMDRIREEIRSLLSGNASTDSLIATMIFGSPSEANSAIKKAKESGTNGLKDMLDSYLGTFDVLEGVDTYSRAVLNLQNSWDSAMQSIVQKSGAFNDIKNAFNDMAIEIESDTDSLVDTFDKLYNNIKKAFNFSDEIAEMTLLLVGVAGFVPAINATSKAVLAFNVAALTMSGTFAALAKNIKKVRLGIVGLAAAVGSIVFADEITEVVNKIKEMTPGWRDETIEVADAIENKQLPAVQKLNKLLKEQANLKRILSITPDNARAKEELEALEAKIKTQNIMAENQKKSANAVESFKKQGQLLTKENVDKNFIQDAIESNKNAKDEIVLIQEEIKKAEVNLSKLGKVYSTLSKAGDKDGLNATKNQIQELSEFIKNKEKEIAEIKQEESDKYQALQEKEIAKKEKQIKANAENAAVLKEIELIEQGNISTESRSLALSELKINSLVEEFSILTKAEDKNKIRLQILKEGLKYEELLTSEKQKQDALDDKTLKTNIKADLKTVSRGADVNKDGILTDQEFDKVKEQLNLLKLDADNLIDENTKTKLKADIEGTLEDLRDSIEPFSIDLEVEGFDDVSNSIAGILNGFTDIYNEQQKYNKLVKDGNDTEKDRYNLANTQISTYADMTSAMSNFYDEDDSRREKQEELAKVMYATRMAMQVAEMAQSTAFTTLFVTQEATKATAAGATAVAVAGQSSPWTGLATAAAMAAMLASFGIMLGGSEKTSESYDSFSSMAENTGTGTVLGDIEAQSDSIANALDTLEDFANPQYQTLQSMDKYLETIASSIGGVTSLLIQSGGFAFGEGVAEYQTDWESNLGVSNNTLGTIGTALWTDVIGLAIDALNIPILSDITGFFGDVFSSVMGGLFGKTSVSQSLKDSGIYFADTLLTEATETITGEAYQTISTTVKKKSWFSSSSKTSTRSYFDDLDDETNRQFSLVLDNLYQTALLAGEALDTSSESVADSLDDFVVSIGKISLKDKTGDEIQEQLEAVFGAIGDDMASTAFPLLTSFQGVGEGMFETLTRVAVGMEEASYYLNNLGSNFEEISYLDIENTQGDVGFEALLQSIVKADESMYGFNNSVIELIKNLDTSAEELYNTYEQLEQTRIQFNFLGNDLVGITDKLILGAGGLDTLNSSLTTYIEEFYTEQEALTYQTSLLSKEFAKANIVMPKTKEEFKTILEDIDLTTSEGQELYGKVVKLSDAFVELIDDSSGEIKDSLTLLFDTLNDSIEDMFTSLSNMEESTRSTLLSVSTESTFEQLVALNKTIREFEVAKEGTDTEETESLYEDILSLAETLSSDSQYTSSITKMLQDNLAGFETEKEVLRVNIVEGLGELLGLSSEQLTQLQTSVSDGQLTNDELSLISNLTAVQKDGIVQFANNSDYFSTEQQQENANELMKLQLQTLRTQAALDTDSLSSNTLKYGDTIGAKEQKDIATLFGTPYENVSSFIENIQGLEVASDKDQALKDILGYTGTSIDEQKYSRFEKLSPYLNEDILEKASSLKDQASTNKVKEEEKDAFYESYNNTATQLEKWKTTMEMGVAGNANLSSGATSWVLGKTASEIESLQAKGWGAGYTTDDTYLGWQKNIERLQSIYDNQTTQKELKGYSSGGYTGDGAKYDIAGLVHKREYVVNSSTLNSLGGPGAIEKILREANMSRDLQRAGMTTPRQIFTTPKAENSNISSTTLINLSNNMIKLIEKVERNNQLTGANLSIQEKIKEAVGM